MPLIDLCTVDVIIDTNVLSHAENSGASQQVSALEVLTSMRASTVLWVLDDQGKAAPDPATSLLFQEYRATLNPQGIAMTLLVECLSYGRIAFAPRPDQATRNFIRKLIPRNNNDRVVLGAAHGSSDRVLVSNDLSDFSLDVRDEARDSLKVTIVTSDEAVE